ncbi:DMT family transporter [Primorskyibacter sp. S87]|uniref:DMT family transporter n=1 Tax=Primorskyibacter sp. S87 TaxID=3415126 RepID=UPI003C7BB4FD
MTRRTLWAYGLFLVILGMGWGLTQPLAKLAVSTGHGPIGLIFWQMVIGAIVLGLVSLVRGKGVPWTPAALLSSILIALIGTVIPNSASYTAIAYLPSGVISILLSLVPMMAFPIALGLGLERFSPRRLAGLAIGLTGVMLLVLPEASLPDRAMLAWIPLALLAPLCYAFEGNYVARWGTGGLDPIQTLFGASLAGAAISLPLAIFSDQFISPLRPWEIAEWALVASSLIHAVVYTGYVWLVGRAGPVFAVQVSYLVTGFGVIFAMLLLGERYSPFIWLAMMLVLAGVFLVQPKRRAATDERLAPAAAIGETGDQAEQ